MLLLLGCLGLLHCFEKIGLFLRFQRSCDGPLETKQIFSFGGLSTLLLTSILLAQNQSTELLKETTMQ